jgi:hypothetical protein
LSSRRKKSPARRLQVSASYFLTTQRIGRAQGIEQDPEVFAAPGKGTNKNSWGPNTLIHQGAKREPQ